jgi:hypothetical protein
MSKTKILIKTVGFIGDILFASSVAKKLRDQYYVARRSPQFQIDFQINLPQPIELLANNPEIDNIYLGEPEMYHTDYDKIYQLQPIHRNLTPCEQFQIQCGISNPTPEYKIYTNVGMDIWVKSLLPKDKVLIAYPQNWEERTFLFTEEEYKRGIDVPNLGYGGAHRNTDWIILELQKRLGDKVVFIPIGKPNGYVSNMIDQNSVSEYTFTASLLKNCNWFIGAEGGLANLAAGVGTGTIITGDFIHQLYGWNGVIEKCQEPKLGPKYYFNNENHTTLDPYLTDEQVVTEIINIIK